METLGLLLQNEARRIHCDPQTKSPQSNTLLPRAPSPLINRSTCVGLLEWILPSQKVRALLAARCCFEVTSSVDRSGFCEPHFAAKARMSPLDSPSVMNTLAPLVRRMFAIAYGENEFMLFQMKGLVWGRDRPC